MSVRRGLQAVTPPDDKITGGRPKLWAYGMGYISDLARVSRRSVRRARSDGRLDPSSPVAVVAYALRKRGARGLARQVLEALAAGGPS